MTLLDDTSEPPAFPMTRETPLDPPAGYRRAREAGGVVRVRLWDGRVAWLVTGYAEVRSLLSDPRISADRGHRGFPFPSPGRATLERSGRTFITMDDLDHRRLRRVFTRYFSVKRVEAFRPIVTEVVDDLITGIEEAGPPVDLVTQLACEVPARTICRVLGLPLEDRFHLQELDNERNTLGTSPEAVQLATDKMLAYVDRLIAEKRQHPDDGMISALVHEQLANQALTHDELVPAIRLLITAGHETTTNMIGLGVLAFLRNPEQLALLRADPSLLPGAVEELLRYISVFHISPTRVATDTIEIAGQVIAAGDGVIPVAAGANRDEAAFPDPDTFDIRRQARHHVAFGYGVHQCLGQALARLELQVVFDTLFRRLPTLRLAVPADQLTIREYAFLSLAELPVTWDPSSPRWT
ncbi:cytochrome P450 [Flindersiella endophytica]